MTRVMVTGTYDVFHPGHEFFLKKARSYGNELHVVLARDETVKKVKGHTPKNDEQKRLEKIQSLEYVTKAYLGNLGDKYKIVEEIKPDIICLGYDQTTFTDTLEEELKKRNIHAKIIRITQSFFPDVYKSSKM